MSLGKTAPKPLFITISYICQWRFLPPKIDARGGLRLPPAAGVCPALRHLAWLTASTLNISTHQKTSLIHPRHTGAPRGGRRHHGTVSWLKWRNTNSRKAGFVDVH